MKTPKKQTDKAMIRRLKEVGFDYKTGFDKIAFVVNNLSGSQLAYCLIYNANQFLHQELCADISVFSYENIMPCTSINFAMFNVSELPIYDGNLIATNFRSAVDILDNAPLAKKFYYMFDVEFIRPWFQESKTMVDTVMNSSKIVKFTRCTDYIDILKNIGYDISNKYIENFDFKQLMEIIHEYDSC